MRTGRVAAGLGGLGFLVLAVAANLGEDNGTCEESEALRLTTSCVLRIEVDDVVYETWELERPVPARRVGAERAASQKGCPDPMTFSSGCSLGPEERDTPTAAYPIRGFDEGMVFVWKDSPFPQPVVLVPYDDERRGYVMSRRLQHFLSELNGVPISDRATVRPRG